MGTGMTGGPRGYGNSGGRYELWNVCLVMRTKVEVESKAEEDCNPNTYMRLRAV